LSTNETLKRLGFTSAFAAHFAAYEGPGRAVARVVTEHRGAYRVRGEGEERWAKIAGKLRHGAASPLDLPAVGDWVVTEGDIIVAVLPRKTSFVRRAAGPDKKPQVVAANVDWAFLVSSLNRDFSPRRLERYLALARESGAEPVILLSKSDLSDPAEAMQQAAEVARGVPIFASSAVTGEGLDVVRSYLKNDLTGVLLGSSGVGKSTLVNRLLGEERLATSDVRDDDDKGRHTTVRRELIALPDGGLLIDTPGMREIGLWDTSAGVDEAFDDVAEAAARCRFSDCKHDKEPGCAVRRGIEEGTISAERAASYKALLEEGERIDRLNDPRAKTEENRKNRTLARAQRAYARMKRG